MRISAAGWRPGKDLGMMSVNQRNRQYLGIALAGGAVGILLGLLLAPRSGRETRRKLSRSLGDGRDALVRNGNRVLDGMTEHLRAS
jgi:gas vesicle protein